MTKMLCTEEVKSVQEHRCLPVSRLVVSWALASVKPPSRSVLKALEKWDWKGITDTSSHVQGSRKEAWKEGYKEGRQASGNTVWRAGAFQLGAKGALVHPALVKTSVGVWQYGRKTRACTASRERATVLDKGRRNLWWPREETEEHYIGMLSM